MATTSRKSLYSKLMAFDRAEGLLRAGDNILIAVSGGPDSVCLAHHLSRLAQRRRLRLALVHFHHGLRGREAERDAEFVRGLADRLGLPFILRRLDVRRTASRENRSLEDAGRALRYRELARLAVSDGFDKAATGHQQDDQAETVILHLLRGTKAKGLGGIPPERPLKGAAGVEVIRPLLALTRREVLDYLKAHRLPFRTDRSNRSEKFTRNWIRSRVVPLLEKKNPRIREHLSALAADVRRLLRLKPSRGC
ncbi:MAG: tRNA lysidine(34) synthetase TilS [Elusimicrobia bacterium]|nr:tRNA lysidine(34) synthetase TilS [Elusimicrobiota bacterium]